jgi:hypothetical protein
MLQSYIFGEKKENAKNKEEINGYPLLCFMWNSITLIQSRLLNKQTEFSDVYKR